MQKGADMQECAIENSEAKDQTIIMRVDAETKRQIETAADARGLTVTTFVVDAAVAAAVTGVVDAPPPKYSSRSELNVPGTFAAACSEAARGGAYGYVRAGMHLLDDALRIGRRYNNVLYCDPSEVDRGQIGATDGKVIGVRGSERADWFS